MIPINNTTESSAIISDLNYNNYVHRYFLERIWDKEKTIATVIMLNPSYADELKWDYSSMRAINFLIDEGYGGITIVNLFSCIETDSENLPSYNQRFDKDTDKYIEKAIIQNEVFIIAWGSNKNRLRRITNLKKILTKHKDSIKISRLTDEDNSRRHVSRLKRKLHLEPIKKINDI
ncbi:DUF1643 domain-containing protein [Clostridium estertheticum]|uniref:DUF1643 domain-containing protein n=1 Tax=Clostridium estertheticum TaxID=238834 RepID=UPI001C6EB28A|nr:DUF1643 domain-containing protein [Clostridium estertheticum]MBW9169766.1 DUF1643 domain-containing protein [Clostridium estertheticum]WLC74728.1 DUF1643 domain-containing protein [Clostridium estertheticum]